MVKICRTGLLKINFEIIQKKTHFPGFAKNFRRPWMKLKNFFCQFPNPWTLRVSGMGGYTSKCEKKSKSLHPTVECWPQPPGCLVWIQSCCLEKMEAVQSIHYRPGGVQWWPIALFRHHVHKCSTFEILAGSLLDVFASLWFPYRERSRGRSTYKG